MLTDLALTGRYQVTNEVNRYFTTDDGDGYMIDDQHSDH